MIRTWYSADHHFGHKNILRFCGRPFTTIEEHDAELIRLHNEVVAPEDRFVQLGDLGMGKIDETIARTSQMNGERFLIPGNHDRMFSGTNSAAYRAASRQLYEDAGWTILDEQVQTTIGGHDVTLSHFPPEGDSRHEDRWTEHRPSGQLPVIHGHVHTSWAERGSAFNVGVDVREYRPVAELTIGVWLDSLAA